MHARFCHPWSKRISTTDSIIHDFMVNVPFKHNENTCETMSLSSDPPPLKPDLPSLESDWLICPGPRRRGLGCSPGLSCAFVDWWRRLFLLETRSERVSTVVVLHDTQLYCIRQEELRHSPVLHAWLQISAKGL